MSLCTSLFDLHISLWSFRVDFLGLSDRKQFLYSSRRQEITWRKKPGFITLIPFPMFSSTIQQECFKFPQTASHISECLLRRCSSSERALGTWDPSVPRSPEKPWKKSNVWNKWACFLQISFICYMHVYATFIYLFAPGSSLTESPFGCTRNPLIANRHQHLRVVITVYFYFGGGLAGSAARLLKFTQLSHKQSCFTEPTQLVHKLFCRKLCRSITPLCWDRNNANTFSAKSIFH